MLSRLLLILAMAPAVLYALPDQQPASGSPCEPTSTFEPFKYGTQWLQWTERERDTYLIGFVDGGAVYFDFMMRQPKNMRNEVFAKTLVKYDSDVLNPVITSLYRDPANVYIRFNSMVFIARDKIAGKDIEPLLRKARQSDCGGNLKK